MCRLTNRTEGYSLRGHFFLAMTLDILYRTRGYSLRGHFFLTTCYSIRYTFTVLISVWFVMNSDFWKILKLLFFDTPLSYHRNEYTKCHHFFFYITDIQNRFENKYIYLTRFLLEFVKVGVFMTVWCVTLVCTRRKIMFLWR